MEIWYVRHGQTDWNVEGRIQGCTDIPLNDTGIKQAYETKALLKDVNFDLAIASPLSRAYQTAKIICEDKAIEIITDQRLVERNFGTYEGTLVQDMPVEDFWDLDKNLHPEGGESTEEVFNRIYGFLEALYQQYPDKRILLTAHGGISIPLRVCLEGVPEDRTVRSLIIRNCEALHYQMNQPSNHKNPFL